MKMRVVGIWLVCVSLMSTQEVRARRFTDDQGRTIEADLVGVRGQNVVLSRKGRSAQWPIAKLSEADQSYVKQWQKNPPPVASVSVQVWEQGGSGDTDVRESDRGFKAPKNIPMLKETTTTTKERHYQIQLSNRSSHDARNLHLSYIMYLINEQNKVVPYHRSETIEEIAAKEAIKVHTEGISFVRNKTKSMTIGSNPLGHLSVGSSTKRSKERLGGIWVRLYETDGSLVGETKSLVSDLRNQKMVWTGSEKNEGFLDLPLPEDFDLLDKILEGMEELKGKLPEPPAGKKKPQFPPRPF